jgi:hypothetical protein
MHPSSRPWAYPQLSAEATDQVARRLAEIVSIEHGDALADDQMQELRSRIGSQLAAAARLHEFHLSNDQEPVFLVRTDEGRST